MIRLFARGEAKTSAADVVLGRITTVPVEPRERPDHVFLLRPGHTATDLLGYAGLLALPGAELPTTQLPTTRVNEELSYLADGDVVLLAPSGRVSVLYRKSSRHNTILSTEQCNSRCLMCSQPPQPEDDSHRVTEILRLIDLIDTSCVELGISGGEPLLLGDGFFAMVERCRDRLPTTALHVLTNGRLFEDPRLAKRLGAVEHPDIMLGIPLYADIDTIHDYVVQAHGAFNQTVLGLYNLAERGIPIELRVVLHAQTYRRLPQLAEYIHRNFPFVSHVALMGLEMFGYTNINLADLWIDPVDYQRELRAATMTLADAGLTVSIYNHQLCTINRTLWPFAKRSISDWKNIFLPECDGCNVRDACAGFFHSAVRRHSLHIAPLGNLLDDKRTQAACPASAPLPLEHAPGTMRR